jgi:hypothetical protein
MPDATQSAPYRTFLDRLLTGGALPASQIPARLRAEADRLVENGVLQWERAGAGRRLTVLQPDLLARIRDRQFPDDADRAASPRATAVATMRNSKQSTATIGSEPIFLRALAGPPLQRNGTDLELVATTTRTGVASVLLQPADQWQYTGRLITVENLECFLHAEQLGLPFDLAIYTAGRISALLLNWLASLVASGATLTHCGDYDPTGLDEFRRLYKATDQRAQLYLPTELPQLFDRYSKPALLAGRSAQLLQRLRSVQHPAVQTVIALIHQHNAALEQEALLLSPSQDQASVVSNQRSVISGHSRVGHASPRRRPSPSPPGARRASAALDHLPTDP